MEIQVNSFMTMVKSCVWLCLWLCALPVRALDPQKAITQLVHTSWTEREGAPGSIWALAQTTDGYLWLGTASGLYRFDGARFTRFEPAAGEELPGTSIGALCATRDGSLWIASAPGLQALDFQKRRAALNYQDSRPDGHSHGYSSRNEEGPESQASDTSRS
jgi:ligand-binding sensor domain-containing protein